MANYTVAAGEVAVHNKTLAADVVDVVSFARRPQYIEVVSDGAEAIYVTTDNSTPTVGGAHTRKLPATPCKLVVRLSDKPVKIISPGTATYSVQVA